MVPGCIWGRRTHSWQQFLVDDTDESITLARVSLYVARFLGIFIQCPSQFLDRTVQAAFKIDEHIVCPEALTKFLPRNKFSWAFQEENQDLQRLSGKFDPNSALPQFSHPALQKIRSETQKNLRRHRLSELVVFHLHQFYLQKCFKGPNRGSSLIVYRGEAL